MARMRAAATDLAVLFLGLCLLSCTGKKRERKRKSRKASPARKGRVQSLLHDARVASVKIHLERIEYATTSFAVTQRRLPSSLEDLVERKYIRRRDLRDPWDQPFHYQVGPNSEIDDFILCSPGPDRKLSTKDDICRAQN